MKFEVTRASDWSLTPLGSDKKPQVMNFVTLNSLLEFIERNGKVIIYPDNKIVIYDDYME